MRRRPRTPALFPDPPLFRAPDGELGKTAGELAKAPGVREAVVVSTCNRVEPYLATDDPAQGLNALHNFIAARAPSASPDDPALDRKSTRLNSSHANISYAVF